MSARNNHFTAFTGGPGAGKTSVIEALGAAGHRCSAEAGRAIIRQQVAIDGAALPWRDRALYAEVMLSWELRAFEAQAEASGPVFFDRGLPDIVGYLRLEGLPVSAHVLKAAQDRRYARKVFLFPPWPEIFSGDAERKQTAEVAAATCRVMAEIYSELGYELIEVPRVSVAERARFILAACRALC
ncbi:AAA family ATPase [Pelagibius sp.]|uniref:AAA family ATPase n=1 Tax=Pelagibius sp. TaxID=1931238 RepID=UPI00262582C3|nr:AAA family ATPase [Pelagibius sp.]